MQHGSLGTKARLQGSKVWEFRWSEKGPHGKRVYHWRVIGIVDQYRGLDAVRAAVAGLIAEVNRSSTLFSTLAGENNGQQKRR